MQIDKRQDSTCTSSISLVLNKSNISSEEIVLLNNNNKVSLVFNSYMKLNFNIMSIKKNLPWLKLFHSKDGSQKK